MTDILTPISPGELLDKITILRIKSENIADPEKLENVKVELAALRVIADQSIPDRPEIQRLTNELQTINKQLWDIEDDIRDCERNRVFDKPFIDLARAVYKTNDVRADLKKQINVALGSRIVEEKSYADY